MRIEEIDQDQLPYEDLVMRYGCHDAQVILKSLEQFEGIREEFVSGLSNEERLRNVFRMMSENLHYQTRH